MTTQKITMTIYALEAATGDTITDASTGLTWLYDNGDWRTTQGVVSENLTPPANM